MPTIPTFTAKGTPTTEVGSVRSTIKVNPRESMAAALAPVGKVAEDYYVQQRENSDNLEYNKILLEIRAETDIAVNLQKDNPNVEEALANVKLQQDSILANKSDITLHTGNTKEVCPLGLTPTTSTTLMKVIGDILIVELIKKIKFTKKEYSQRHHSGYLGQKSKE